MDNSYIQQVVDRHRRFWDKRPAAKPLLGFPFEWEHSFGIKLGLKPGPLTPDMLNPEIFVAFYEDAIKEAGLFEGELFRVASAHRIPWESKKPDGTTVYRSSRTASIHWSSLFLGCEIEISSDAIWTKPLPEGKAPTQISEMDKNPWFIKAVEITEILRKKFSPAYPVGLPDLLGPADMVAAILGTENMCLGMVDNPGKIKALNQFCTDFWLAANTRLKEYASGFQGGFCNGRYQIWAPDVITTTQDDCAMFFSPKRYADILTPVNQRVFASSDYSIMHVHTAAAHTFDAILSVPGLGALQIMIDPTGPSVSDLIPVFDKVQKAGKSLILIGEFKKPELEEILKSLRPEGLCITASTKSDKAALELMRNMIEEKDNA